MWVPILILVIVILGMYIPKNNAKSVLIREFKPLFEQRLENPLMPPERTYPSNRINIKTQGEDTYQQVGFVHQQSSGTRLPLFGRRDFRSSDTWEYYVKDNKDDNDLKIPIEDEKELYNDDVVNIPSYSGDMMVTIYDVDLPKYLPTVY